MLLKKYQIREQRARLGHGTYFSILGSLDISGTAKATNLQKLSMVITGISGQSLYCGPGAEPILEGAEEGALSPKLNIYIPISQFCQQFCSRMLWRCYKISQTITFSHSGGYHLPHPSLYQPEASCGNLVSSNCNWPQAGRGEGEGEMWLTDFQHLQNVLEQNSKQNWLTGMQMFSFGGSP